VTGPLRAFARLADLWGLRPAESATLLGLSDTAELGKLLDGVAPLRHRDTRDRLRYLLLIRAHLDRLFRDPAVERQWLRQAQEGLGDQSPLATMLEGSMANLLRARPFVEWVCGR
jgi:hypothetical protein